jgi:ABC-type cobalamin transport system permease subunit
MQKNLREYIVRLVVLFLGLTIAHLGVTLFILSDLGADPFNVLIQGLHRLAGAAGAVQITHGMTHMAVCFLIILILLMGSLLLLVADTLSRVVGGGAALPVGAVTSLLGAPFFVGVIFSKRRQD